MELFELEQRKELAEEQDVNSTVRRHQPDGQQIFVSSFRLNW